MTAPTNRRDFLRAAALAAAGALVPWALGSRLARASELPDGKQGLIVHNLRPLNAETPVALLDTPLTETHHFFVRNNGVPPKRAAGDLADWALVIDGAVNTPLTLTLDALRALPTHQADLVLECGGNGRAGFSPLPSGNAWQLGAVGCARFTGVRLRDVLAQAGVRDDAVWLAYEGEDTHLSGDPRKRPISRGCPIGKALDGHTMLAWSMNGEPLTPTHGFPLRLIVPGHPASASGKWLRRLWVRDQVHDGAKMTDGAYRVPVAPNTPGATVSDDQTRIIYEMPVKSVITWPHHDSAVRVDAPVALRGKAWSGSGDVTAVDISLDFGQTWQRADLDAPANRYAWQAFKATIRLPQPGAWQVWARATDETGVQQPMVVPGWNPKGYLNNAMHRVQLVAS